MWFDNRKWVLIQNPPEREERIVSGRGLVAAAIQMSSTPDKEENKATAEALIQEAASSGADLVALPELWSCHGLDDVYRENAEPVPGPTTAFLASLARALGVYVLGGSILEGEPGAERRSWRSRRRSPCRRARTTGSSCSERGPSRTRRSSSRLRSGAGRRTGAGPTGGP